MSVVFLVPAFKTCYIGPELHQTKANKFPHLKQDPSEYPKQCSMNFEVSQSGLWLTFPCALSQILSPQMYIVINTLLKTWEGPLYISGILSLGHSSSSRVLCCPLCIRWCPWTSTWGYLRALPRLPSSHWEEVGKIVKFT